MVSSVAHTRGFASAGCSRPAAKDYRARGWRVRSVEHDKLGYDLACTKGRKVEHVEVKGVRGREPVFYIAEGERRKAQADASFAICVVTQALTKRRVIRTWPGREVAVAFELAPVQYRARLK